MVGRPSASGERRATHPSACSHDTKRAGSTTRANWRFAARACTASTATIPVEKKLSWRDPASLFPWWPASRRFRSSTNVPPREYSLREEGAWMDEKEAFLQEERNRACNA